MFGATGELLMTIANAIIKIGENLGMKASDVTLSSNLSDNGAATGMTVFFNMAVVPFLDATGHIISATANVISSLADALGNLA